MINIVWFKRDLRLSDHAPLATAISDASRNSAVETLLLYIFEPMLLSDPHYSNRHWRFVTQSLQNLNHQLRPFNARICVAHNDALAIFKLIAKQHDITAIYSHQETGLANTFERDRSISAWCASNTICWHEYQSGAVHRAKPNRETWDRDWNLYMRSSIIKAELNKLKPRHLDFDTSELNAEWKCVDTNFQFGGSQAAWNCLHDFFEERGQNYHWQISKPEASRVSCSRLSPYLAWGNISLREVYQHLLENWSKTGWRRALVALSSRLHWHCHFIQKFESECRMQHQAVNRAYERLEYRDLAECQQDLVAWQSGYTGFPLVDACMRALHATGYVNFRMRAMLVSFLCHHLNIDWRYGVEHLAALFLDFEPGIHYPQFQMQAGVTGINTIRIYNPTKQAQEHDPEAAFIKRWCPELSQTPKEQSFEPWKLTMLEQQMYELRLSEDYPMPLVELKQSYKESQQRLWAFKKRPDVKREAQRILARHVRTT